MRNDKIYARNNKNCKSKVSTFELGDYCLKRMLYWLGIVFELLLACLVAEVCQASNVFSNSERAFVNDTRIVKIYAMVKWPRMFRNVGSISTCFDVPDMFLLASFKTPAGFTYITPFTIGKRYFINHIGLMFNWWSEFGRRKFLL